MSDNKYQISLAPELVLVQYNELKQKYQEISNQNNVLNNKILELNSKLDYERTLREKAEAELLTLKRPKRNRRTKKELELQRLNDIEYNPLKKNGVKKATSADFIPSYATYKQIVNYFDNKISQSNKHYATINARNKLLLILGVSFGVRIGDLLSLKFKNILNEDGSFKNSVTIIEDKTNKLNNLLITECVKKATTEYVDILIDNDFDISLNDFIFSKLSKTSNKPLDETGVWRMFNSVQKELNLDFHFSTHTLRQTFINIVACVDRSTIDMNMITKCQVLLNHNDQTTTMRYMGVLKNLCNHARESVSDWLLGKSNIDELSFKTDDNISNKLDEILNLFN